MATVLITGANRGLGLEFAKQYHQEGWEVFATCRSPETAHELTDLGIDPVKLDVSDPESIAQLPKKITSSSIDVLINNAGVHDGPDAKDLNTLIEPEKWIQGFKVNVMAPVLITKTLLTHLKSASRPVGLTIGSLAGCPNRVESGGLYMYRSTKAGAHLASVTLAKDLEPHGIPYLIIRPGWTKTDMAGYDAPFETSDTIRKIREVISKATMDHSGKFIDRSGEILSWIPEDNLNS